MKTFKITLDLTVEAETKEQAIEKALLEASQHDFTGHIHIATDAGSNAQVFLLTVTLFEGEHEHTEHALIEASSQEEAQKIAEKQIAFDNSHSNQDEGSYFAYGESDVEAQVDNVRQISVQQAELLREFGLAYFLQRQK